MTGRFTIEDFDRNMEEIRQRRRLGTSNSLPQKLQQAAKRRIPRIGRR